MSPTEYEDVAACADEIIRRLGPDIDAATPLGLGKPNQLLNELVERAAEDPSLDLTIWTALTLTKPTWQSDLERRLVEPLSDRLFGDYPPISYAEKLRDGELPDNVEIQEFYLAPGEYLDVPVAQQNHRNVNYTHALDELRRMELDLLVQLIGIDESGDGPRYNLSCNTDLSSEVIPMLQNDDSNDSMVVGQVNRNLPVMAGEGPVDADQFDAIVDSPTYDFQLFGTPRRPINDTDYAIGLRVSSLLRDDGTIQIGIGSLGDAIAHAATLRHHHNDAYRQIIDALDGLDEPTASLIDNWGGLSPFDAGLYGGTELFTDAYLHLADAGILTREVYHDSSIQQVTDEGLADGESDSFDIELLDRLCALDAIHNPLRERDVDYLKQHGVLVEHAVWREGKIGDGDKFEPADLKSDDTRALLEKRLLGDQLDGGTVVDAAFFLGSSEFYERLRQMPAEQREKFAMRSVSFTNQLLCHEQLNRRQRRHARFVNTAMKATLTGGVVSDGLEDNRVVSGVGGQFNFVNMAHELQDGRSIIMVRATRSSGGEVESNIVWNYGHITIPRHLRDIVVTEYGVADLRGKSDADVIAAMIEIADARFQDQLVEQAKQHGKLPADYEVPASARNNTPDQLAETLEPFRREDTLPEFPFGTELTDTEVTLTRALRQLDATVSDGLPDADKLGALLRSISIPDDATPYLERLNLDAPDTLRERALRHLVTFALIDGNHLQ